MSLHSKTCCGSFSCSCINYLQTMFVIQQYFKSDSELKLTVKETQKTFSLAWYKPGFAVTHANKT